MLRELLTCSECLRSRLLSGVKVAVVQPGSFRSGLLENAGEALGGEGRVRRSLVNWKWSAGFCAASGIRG